ncbi:Kelch repeat-containing protein [Paraliomyxa miuraensis]|uniref:hypothetical protein n=1 Tax=Paraliomyxa miuraensis TaxID=376150 RepID=UPI0022526405|nr:hypothetical protein [Paraliomyxa miuraensis]
MLGHGLALALLGALSACGGPEPPRLVAQVGCGIDDDLISSLRVQARGDFPTSGGTQVLLSDGEETMAWGDLPVVGVTVEGLLGQTVEAVGRTARLAEEGDVPVYFARVDGMCPVEDDVGPRIGMAAAVGREGDVVAVGGRDAQGQLAGAVVHLHDQDGDTTRLRGASSITRVGHSVHALGDRRFLVVGGTSEGTAARDDVVLIDLDDEGDPVGAPLPVVLPPEDDPARAYHAAAVGPDGRILLVGGCKRLNDAQECALDDDDDDPSVLGTAVWIEAVGSSLVFRPGPEVVIPRFGATVVFERDGVAFLAGGTDAAGQPVHVVERYRPDSLRFRRYGGEPRGPLDEGLAVVGVTVLEGGLVVLAMADGRIHWITEHTRDEYRPWAGWCEGEAPCFADLSGGLGAGGSEVMRRGLVTLPGERVLADGVLLPVAGVGQDGTDVLDLFVPGPGRPMSTDRRVDTTPVALADGSVLLLGGRDPATGALVEPLALRIRPALDGPDERIPEVDRAALGSWVVHDPERVVLEGETLRLLATESTDPRFPRVRAHARGFRSTSLRFEATVQVNSGEVVPHIVLGHGGVEAVSVSLEPDRIQAHLRDPQERVQDFSCAPFGIRFDDEAKVLRVEVRPSGVLLREGGQVVAQCPVTFDDDDPRPWSVGMGASGTGDMRVYGVRLTRL